MGDVEAGEAVPFGGVEERWKSSSLAWDEVEIQELIPA
jgi:hypothetical protein